VSRPNERQRVGLCAECAHGHRVVSAKGSEFWLCAKSDTDPRFAKYPRLPVLECGGYEPPHPVTRPHGSGAR